MSISNWLFDNKSRNIASVLPDHYRGGKRPDEEIAVVCEDEDNYLLVTGRQLKCSYWHNVYIVARDQLVITALRYLLAPLCPVRLRICQDLNALNNTLSASTALVPDQIIWATSRGGYQPGMVSMMIRLKRQFSHLSQLAILDGFPCGMEKIAESLADLKIINANVPLANISWEIERQLLWTETKTKKPLFNGFRLTRRQWEILLLLAESKPAKEIAKYLNIDIHTVSSHRSTALQRLNISRHEQRVWLYQIFHEVISEVPGLKRGVRQSSS